MLENDFEQEDNYEDFPLTYAIDNDILMHRDAHFGGDFPLMIEYYRKEGRGISKEFDLERIEELAVIEKQGGKNLAATTLSGPEAEKIARTREVYKQLRALYELSSHKNKIPLLIADLILAEDEEIEAAVQAVVAEKSAIVPALIDLLRNEEFYDPLFPGYGLAPALAAECLGLIGDKRAIVSLFEAIGEADFFNEDVVLHALYAIGEPAKEFLLKVLHGHPINNDNERAAIALVRFKDDPEVSSLCLKMLKEIDLKKDPILASYLILACEGLKLPEQRQELLNLANLPTIPKTVQLDIKAIKKSWESKLEE